MNAQLTKQLAEQLDTAFPDLVDAHGTMVMTMATRLTDSGTAQDITQEVFLRAYRALSGYTTDRILALDLRPWLATITRNLVRNEYRRRERKGTLPLNVANDRTANDNGIPDVETHDELNRVLVGLTDAQREAVVLRHIVGLPLSEVALTMACPVGTAKSHVSRGLTNLRQALGSEGESE